jgi:hypothetical protein
VPRLYNESPFVAREIIELELGVQKSQGNGNIAEYNRKSENEKGVQLSVGNSHGKLVVEEEL